MDNTLCELCQLGKMHRLPFGTRVKTTSSGELYNQEMSVVHLINHLVDKDILIVIKDHYSHYRYYFVSKEKSVVKEALH